MAAIYKITNLLNNKIYIGLTTKTIQQRLKQHIRDARHRDYPLYNSVRKYGWENFKIEAIVEGDFNRELLCELEKHYIQLYNSYIFHRKGYNLTLGGGGVSGKSVSEETRLKISNSMKKLCENPKQRERLKSIAKRKHSPETIEKFKNRITSLETRKKLSESKIGVKLSDIHRKAMSLGKIGKPSFHNRKPIIQLDLQGNLVKEWDYASQPSKDPQYSNSSIQKCLSGLRKQHKGFIWKYKEREN